MLSAESLSRACKYLNEDREAHMKAHGSWYLDPGKLEAALNHAEGIEEVWDDNLIQFARLLCEIVATQDVADDLLMESMDLTSEEIDSLFERAHIVWEEAKCRL